jgi:hypothetical protein
MHIRRSTRRAFVSAFLLCGAAGCADLDTVRNAPLDKGISRQFDVPYDRLTAAALTALSSVDVNIVSSSEDAGGTIYLVDKSLTITSWGEVGRIYVKRSVAPPTTLIVYWEKRARAGEGIDAREFTRVFFEAIGRNL